MPFVRGIYGLCSQCSSELSLRTDVARVAKTDEGYVYLGGCPSCSAQNQTIVDRETHVAGVEYLRQVVANKNAASTIFEPVNPLEEELFDFVHFLGEATTDTIWAEILASS